MSTGLRDLMREEAEVEGAGLMLADERPGIESKPAGQ
jgi:hypothetical protein